MKSFTSRLLIAAMAIVLGSAIARSQDASDAPPPQRMHGPDFGMGGGREDSLRYFARALNLTADQKSQMTALMQKEHPAMKPLFQQQHQIDQQLRQYVEGPYDEVKVRALAEQKAQVETELTVAQTRVHNGLYQLLTADQKEQLKAMEAKRDARIEAEMSRHHGPPAPPSE
jgi:Spy/CpxP family protein refolding chaperone